MMAQQGGTEKQKRWPVPDAPRPSWILPPASPWSEMRMRSWSAVEDARVDRLSVAGWTSEEIGARLGRSAAAVRNRRKTRRARGEHVPAARRRRVEAVAEARALAEALNDW